MNQVPDIRGPLGLKPEKKPKRQKEIDARFAGLREIGCIVCHQWDLPQRTPTEIHHVCSGRYSRQRAPDEMTIGLCRCHHQGDTGTGRVGIHKAKATWEHLFGKDYEFLPIVNDMLAGEAR